MLNSADGLQELSQLLNLQPPNKPHRSSTSTTAKPRQHPMVSQFAVAKSSTEKATQSKRPSRDDNIWDMDQVPEQSMLLPSHTRTSDSDGCGDTRPQPEYTIKYRQQIGAGDVYLGLDGSKAPGLIGCDEMVVEIQLPAVQSIKELDLEVTRKYIDLRCPVYKLVLPLQFDIDSNRSAAQWISDRRVLRLILPIERSLPAVIS